MVVVLLLWGINLHEFTFIQLAPPISNGGLMITPPGYNTGAAKAGSQAPLYCQPPMEGFFTLSHLPTSRSLLAL